MVTEITEESLLIYDFQDTTANYIRLIGHGNSTGSWNSYTEFEVWGWPQETSDTVGIKTFKTKNLLVYPNPSNGLITLETEPGSVVKVCDMSGKILQVYTIRKKKEVLDTGLTEGCYLLRVENELGNSFSKIIVE